MFLAPKKQLARVELLRPWLVFIGLNVTLLSAVLGAYSVRLSGLNVTLLSAALSIYSVSLVRFCCHRCR